MSGWLSGQHGSRQGLSWEVAGSTGVPVLGGGEAQVMVGQTAQVPHQPTTMGHQECLSLERVRLGILLGQRKVETGAI